MTFVVIGCKGLFLSSCIFQWQEMEKRPVLTVLSSSLVKMQHVQTHKGTSCMLLLFFVDC